MSEINAKGFEIVSKIVSESLNEPQNGELLEICVDCYQMMNGITISARQNDVSPHEEIKESSQKKSFSTELNKSSHKHSDNSDHTCLKSPESITMLSLNHIKNINNSSPLFSKIALSQHSTPTLSVTPAISEKKPNDICSLNEESSPEFNLYSSHSSISKLSRKSLTLDLQPVYTKSP